MEPADPGAGSLGSYLAAMEGDAAAVSAASSPVALPHELRAGMEAQIGEDLAGVRVHTGDDAAALAAAEGAHAVTIGDDIYMGAGAYQPDAAEGQALLAHEATHAAQQRATGPQVQRASIADAAKDAAANGAERDANREASRFLAGSRGQDVNARTYVQLHQGGIIGELRVLLDTLDLPTGHPGLDWTDPGRFKAFAVRRLDVSGAATFVDKLREVVAPTDLFAVVDQNRVLTKVDLFAGAASQLSRDMAGALAASRDPQTEGAVGPRAWSASVGTAIAGILQAKLIESLGRVAPRYFHAARVEQRAAAEEGREAQAVQQRDLFPSHPLDWVVAGALCEPDVIHVAAGPEDITPGAPDPNRNRRVQFTWQGALGLWNYVRVTSPADPTPEEVAKSVLGRHDLAHRLVVAPPLYGIPEDLAEDIPAARMFRPAAVGERRASEAAPVEHDPLVALGTSGVSDVAALDAARATLAAREQQRQTAGLPALPAVPVDREAIGAAAGRSLVQLQAIASIVEPYGLAGHLEAPRAWLVAKQGELASAPDDTLRLWAEAFRGQQHVLLAIATDLHRLAQQIDQGTAADPWADRTQLSPSQREMLVAYLRAAAVAHVPDTAMTAIAEARARQRDAIPEALTALLAQAIAKVEQLKAVSGSVEREQAASRKLFGMSVRARHQELTRKVADLRARLQLGQVEAAEIQRLHGDCDALVFEAELLANLGSVRQVLQVIEQLLGSDWVAAAGQIEDLEPHRATATFLKMQMSSIHGKWLRLQEQAAAIALGMELGRVGEEQAIVAARELIAEHVDAIRAKLDQVASNQEVHAFLQAAYDEIEDAQQKAMILQIAVFIGVTIISSAVGGAAGSAAGTLLRGSNGAKAVAALTEIVVESATMSGIQAQITGDSFVEAMTVDLGQNLLTLGALKSWEHLLATSKLGRNLVRGADVSRAAYYTAKGIQLTGNVAVIGVTQLVGMQAEAAIKEGRALTVDEVVQNGAQGIAMMIGTGVLTRLLARPLDRIKGSVAGAVDLHIRGKQVETLARKVEETGDPAEALELLRQDRALIEAELAEYQRLAEMTPENLRRMGINPHEVTAWRDGAAQALGEVDAMSASHVAAALGLRVVVPGHTYSGPAKQVDAVVADYRAKGFHVHSETLPEGNVRHTLTSEDSSTRLEVVADPEVAPRPLVIGADPRLQQVARIIEPLPNTLDVIVHGDVDEVEVDLPDGRKVTLDHRRLATLIEKSGGEYSQVRLVSCRTGAHPKAIAQHLANKLGLDVVAPTNTLWVHPDGRMTIGPKENRDNGKWETIGPKKSEFRSKPYRPPAGHEDPGSRAARRRPPESASNSERHADPPVEVSTTRDPAATDAPLHVDSTTLEQRVAAASELASIPVAKLSRSADPNLSHTPDAYLVSPDDGARMLGLLAHVPGVQTKEYAKGFLVRRGRDEWYFEYDAAKDGAGPTLPRQVDDRGIGLPAPNAATVEIWGFRGVRTIDGRPRDQWTPEELADIDRLKETDPLLVFGHVGISVDGGATIYGFTPAKPETMSMRDLVAALLRHEAFPGVVKDDTDVFLRARERAEEDGWNTELISATQLIEPGQPDRIHEEYARMASMLPGEHGYAYSFPDQQPDSDLNYFRDSNGYCGDNVRNCAIFPEKLGVPLPEQSGQLARFIEELRTWADADAPIDSRNHREAT